ncbi:general stress protein [Alkalicoccus saliphilus]|jgi:ribosome recycling factor|uniref:General stress protein n=1 Tax=Alkalicoccus saliphilus TaxID=200989 RepID=A0A2T4U8G7_9BACI|nr:general stress protein [Alkalicoccus saliphilus]PTL39685.1 general stress protein [Alkalicoccus saliphilus]
MDPKYKLFHNDQSLNESISNLRKDGVSDEDIYVLSHDNDHERRTRKSTDANKIGVSETGTGTALKNVFRSKGDKLRTKMKEMGISSDKAEDLEEELDKGKTLLIVTNQDKVNF